MFLKDKKLLYSVGGSTGFGTEGDTRGVMQTHARMVYTAIPWGWQLILAPLKGP